MSPEYVEVMVWLPADNDDVVSIALPPFKPAVPRGVEPSVKVTVPVGVRVPTVGVTVAVKVTGWP
jgi:hypothetical protein